ncbi:MAG: hypothetical protein HQK96_18345 [Nitrospirae bacterium]|nr:hypothetical protein [Nitrospirota bacterium]
MKKATKHRKKVAKALKQTYGKQEIVGQMCRIIMSGKQGLDILIKELGGQVAEAIMYIERDEKAGPDYQPFLRQGNGRASEVLSVKGTRKYMWVIQGFVVMMERYI